MKKYLSIILVILMLIILSTSVFATGSGNNDIYGGHFTQEDGKAVSYCFYEKSHDDSGNDFTGWEITFDVPVKWENREQYPKEQFDPINENKTCFGEWHKVEFDSKGNVKRTNRPTKRPTQTPVTTEPTEEPTESIDTSESPVTTEPTKEPTEEPTESIDTSESPVTTESPIETTVTITTATSSEELPQTGEGSNALVIFGVVILVVGTISLIYVKLR